MTWRWEHDDDGKPTRGFWVSEHRAAKTRPPTYDEWRADEMIRRDNGRPITA